MSSWKWSQPVFAARMLVSGNPTQQKHLLSLATSQQARSQKLDRKLRAGPLVNELRLSRVLLVWSGLIPVSLWKRKLIVPRCEFCIRGNPNICANLAYCGHTENGTLTQYFVCPAHMTVPIPESVSWLEAGCIQPLAIAVQLGRRANMRAHQTVAVL